MPCRSTRRQLSAPQPSTCRYQGLAQRFPEVPQYHLYWAQSLCKAGLFAEASRAAAGVHGFQQASPTRSACGSQSAGGCAR
jgi:hypothetical protein